MSNKTVLNIKIDKDLKKQAQETAAALGLPISTVVTSNLRNFVSSRSITISDEPTLRPEVEKELLELSRAAKEGREDLFSPVFKSAKDSIAWLKKR